MGTLRAIREACDYMTAMGMKRELRQHWQRAEISEKLFAVIFL
jgi:hypothetical protein